MVLSSRWQVVAGGLEIKRLDHAGGTPMQFELTLKAFANSSPGLRFCNPGGDAPIYKERTLKALRRETRRPVELLQSCHKTNHESNSQGFIANPGLKLANAFSVKYNGGLLDRSRRFKSAATHTVEIIGTRVQFTWPRGEVV